MDITNPEIRKTTGKALLQCGHKLQKRSALWWETRIYYNQLHVLLPRKTYQRVLKVKGMFCITFPGQFTVPNYGISPISTFVMALWWYSSRNQLLLAESRKEMIERMQDNFQCKERLTKQPTRDRDLLHVRYGGSRNQRLPSQGTTPRVNSLEPFPGV